MPRNAFRHQVILKEHTSVTVPRSQLRGDDLDKLRASRVVTLTEVRGGYALRARATCGVLQLDRIRLVLQPKFPIEGERLIDWLCYANKRPEPDEALRNWPLGGDGYAGLVPAALLHECRLLLRRGPRRDYVRRQRVDTTLRGRLDVEAQATRCYGAVDRLHLQTFEYEDGGWENLVCGAALTVAARRSSDPRQTRLLLDAAAQFPSPRRPRDALLLLARGRYNRLNSHYRAAHAWARVLLGGGGVADLLDPHGFGAKCLLLDLNVLWENVVKRMAVDAAAALGGRLARREEGAILTYGCLGDRTPPSFRPDGLLAFPPAPGEPGLTRFLTVDAKYKAYAKKNVLSDDRHQLLTYIAGYTTADAPLALVVYPAPGGASPRELVVQGPRGVLGVIGVLGLDTRLGPEKAAGPLREAIAGFAGSAGSGGSV
ncbi:5-methylcytosine restriction system specificity protein McrC [Streptomyces sp. NPDC003032]